MYISIYIGFEVFIMLVIIIVALDFFHVHNILHHCSAKQYHSKFDLLEKNEIIIMRFS